MTVPDFFGDMASVESFVATIEAHRSVMCWHDFSTIKVMCLHCKGNTSAFGWRHVNDKGSLEEVVQALRNTFTPRRPDAFSWLSECMQAEDATMALYAQTFLQHYEQCCHGEVSEVQALQAFSARLEHMEQAMNRRLMEETTGSRTEGVLQKTNDMMLQTLANDPAFVLSTYLNGKALAEAQEATPVMSRPRAQPAPEVQA
eukprot:m51a1_g13471 hypothetical protein (201) ;mRNA; f:1110-1712